MNLSTSHFSNICALPCETLNAHGTCATLELLQKETTEFIPPQLWYPNSLYI